MQRMNTAPTTEARMAQQQAEEAAEREAEKARQLAEFGAGIVALLAGKRPAADEGEPQDQP